jgi:two-component system, chemotaxis family, protein-glutamate methylesterase/glutaminase
MNKKKVLVVDDSIFMRRVISDAVNQQSDMEVVGSATSGEEVLSMVHQLRPDVISLDIEMPKKNGLIALQEVMKDCPTPVVMCSTLTDAGAQATIVALEIGALDFVCKPQTINSESLMATFSELIPKLRTAASSRNGIVMRRVQAQPLQSPESSKVLIVASSTGGPRALMTLFELLPKEMKIPAIIVQHMPKGFTASLSQRLDKVGSFRVREAADGDILQPGVALMAPGGMHIELVSENQIRFNDGFEELGVKPCANILLRSAAKHLREKSLVAILTGMGRDGSEGALAVKAAGGMIFGESASTCTVYGMSKAAMDAGAVHAEFPLHELPIALVGALGGKKRAA